MQEIMNFEGGGYEPVMLVGPVPQRRPAVGRKVLAGAAAAAMGLAVVALVVYSADPNQGAASMSAHSSCVGSSCGIGAGGIGGEMHFGATEIQRSDAEKHWLQDDQVKPMIGSDQGMYNGYAAIKVNWADTTNMDNIRAADITDSAVAGSWESIAANTIANNVRGGHTVHTDSTTDDAQELTCTMAEAVPEDGGTCVPYTENMDANDIEDMTGLVVGDNLIPGSCTDFWWEGELWCALSTEDGTSASSWDTWDSCVCPNGGTWIGTDGYYTG